MTEATLGNLPSARVLGVEFLIQGQAAELAEELEAESRRGVASRIIIDQKTWLGGGRNFECLPFESEIATDQKVWEIA